MAQPDRQDSNSTDSTFTNTNEWFRRTFSSKDRTAELLQPELNVGNITWQDYDAAVNFFPSTSQKWSPILGSISVAAISTAFGLLRKPRWPPQKLALYSLGYAFIGNDAGEILVWLSRVRFFRNLQNPEGFDAALRNIHIRMNENKRPELAKPVPVFDRPSSQDTPQPTDPSSTQWGWQDSDGASSASNPRDDDLRSGQRKSASSQPSSRSRWDEIRMASKIDQSKPSAWQRLRENQGREVHRNGPQENGLNPGQKWPQSDADRERAIAQEQFDKLLEEERKLSSH